MRANATHPVLRTAAFAWPSAPRPLFIEGTSAAGVRDPLYEEGWRAATGCVGRSRHHAGGPASSPSRAFTLVELLVSSTLAALIMASVLSSYIFLGRSLARLANHQALEAKGRAALTLMRGDFTLARAVKTGTTPTSTSLTLTLPSGEVTYTFDNSSGNLRRQATTGVSPDLVLLTNAQATCTAFSFDYYTTSGGSPTASGTNVPYSIKQIQVRFTLATPSGYDANTRVTLAVVSPRFLLRNRQAATGS